SACSTRRTPGTARRSPGRRTSGPTQALRRGLVDGTAAAAVRSANIPILLSVLFQLTGEDRWIAPPYLPTRTRGLEDHDTGGLDEDVQEQVRQAALEALADWAAGTPVAKPEPTGDELVGVMSANVGQAVSPDYEPMMAELLGFRTRPAPATARPVPEGFEVLVIGAGVSGMALGVQLAAAGVPFRILEKNDEVGGTWLENRYPGCGVDTPSYLYSFSFRPHRWSTHFGKRDEVEDYLRGLADAHDLRRHIEFGVEVTALTWNEAAHHWEVTERRPDGGTAVRTAPIVVTAVGQLNRPKIPAVPGAETFAGLSFHSAQWPAGLSVAGKRVAVVGSGASAMQIVPAIAGEVAELTVLQRSPQWIAPNDNYFRPVPPGVHWLLDNVPYYHRWYRFRLAWNFNDKVHATLHRDPSWTDPATINSANDGHRRHLVRYIERQLEGRPDLLAKSVPRYPPFAKRMLLDNGWYAALRQDNVTLVDSGPQRIVPEGVVSADGRLHEVDVIVYATGFDAQRLLHPLDITGRKSTIREDWGDDDPRAYLGMATPGYPNLFFLYGPNTNLGHGGSWITMAECQARYLSELVCAFVDRELTAVECTPAAYERYNDDLDATHQEMVWAHPGVTSWYRNAAGRVVTNMPWRVADYWRMTAEVDLGDFDCRTAQDAGARPAAPPRT
ncbi:flavin-containing monooxygenase, partial [Streptomyces tendae]